MQSDRQEITAQAVEPGVFCQIAREEIPAEICRKEQGGRACAGCKASIRQCTKCKEVKPLVDLKRGRCADCAPDEQLPTRAKVRNQVGDVEEALRFVIDQLEAVQDGGPLCQANAGLTDDEELVDQVPPEFRSILYVICKHFRLGLGELLQATRVARIAIPRQTAIYFCRVRTGMSHPRLAAFFRQDSSTVQFAVDKIIRERAESAHFENLLAQLERAIDEYVPGEEQFTLPVTVPSPRMNIPKLAPAERGTVTLALSGKINDLSLLHHTLMQHATERQSAWIVQVPMTVLGLRIPLTPEEAEMALTNLAEAGYLQGQSPWEGVILCRTEGIEEIQRAASGGARSPRRGAHTAAGEGFFIAPKRRLRLVTDEASTQTNAPPREAMACVTVLPEPPRLVAPLPALEPQPMVLRITIAEPAPVPIEPVSAQIMVDVSAAAFLHHQTALEEQMARRRSLMQTVYTRLHQTASELDEVEARLARSKREQLADEQRLERLCEKQKTLQRAREAMRAEQERIVALERALIEQEQRALLADSDPEPST